MTATPLRVRSSGGSVIISRPVRPRRLRTGLISLFTMALLIFPSAVALAGPLRSNGAPSRLIGMGMATLLALDLLRRRRAGATVRAEPIVVLVLLYLASELFFFGWRTLAGAESAGVLRELLFSVAACGVALFTATRVRSVIAVQRIVGFVLAGCTLSAAVAMAQVVAPRFAWVDLVTLPGFTQVTSTTGLGGRLGLVRVLGTSSHPIEYGVILGACLPLALHLLIHGRSRRSRAAAGVASAAIALGLPFALSRGGMICIAVASLVFLTVQPWTVRAVTAFGALVAGILAFLAAPGLFSALVRLFVGAGEDQSIAGRTGDFAAVDDAFTAAPWLGGAPVSGILDNQWFIVLTERGLVGVAAFAALILLPLVSLVATAWRLRRLDTRRQSLAAALAGGITAIMVSAGVFDLMSFGQAALLLFLFIGLSAAVLVTPEQAAALAADQSARTVSTSPPSSITLPSPSVMVLGRSTAP